MKQLGLLFGAIGDRTDFNGEILGIDIKTQSLFEVKREISDIKNYLFSLGFNEEPIGKGIDEKKKMGIL